MDSFLDPYYVWSLNQGAIWNIYE